MPKASFQEPSHWFRPQEVSVYCQRTGCPPRAVPRRTRFELMALKAAANSGIDVTFRRGLPEVPSISAQCRPGVRRRLTTQPTRRAPPGSAEAARAGAGLAVHGNEHDYAGSSPASALVEQLGEPARGCL